MRSATRPSDSATATNRSSKHRSHDPPRGTVAIVGPSGGGKTTLVEPAPAASTTRPAGRITFDGVDLRDATLASLRGSIGLVTQDTILFDAIRAGNIAYGRPDARAEWIESRRGARGVRRRVHRAAPEGYETRFGENAGRLSGGQKQRLAIARAIYKDAPILILDEATSQLDTESGGARGQALDEPDAGRTTLVIAHRLSTVRSARTASSCSSTDGIVGVRDRTRSS